MGRRKAIATAKMVMTIGFAIFALFAFNMGVRAATEAADQVLAQLAKEVADRIAKSMIMLDSVEKGTVALTLPAKYEVRVKLAKGDRTYVIKVRYKNYDWKQSKRFTLGDPHPSAQISVYGNGNDGMKRLCIMKYQKLYGFVNPNNPSNFKSDSTIARKSHPQPKDCAFAG